MSTTCTRYLQLAFVLLLAFEIWHVGKGSGQATLTDTIAMTILFTIGVITFVSTVSRFRDRLRGENRDQ